ncbi:MAG: UvrD-helicase domain-containing protein [Candidatus Nitricoxidivorans perseverans]|uniref:DNA 3'-5' helicase n=1 Tax=Candidatus Nitricoxidivorans perseverans TaxID=2975601 RepID=A0AA49IWK1_9PROT|nr:MAG: UvrD-helicase domain-containing protein [Candidatus Nitricoxidivorans perseverans]
MTDLLVLDAESRLRALEEGSFIVEAPAGAGKTELLTQRVLMLLAHVEAPEEIVAITFTNKAAAEMRSRILDALSRAADDDLPAEPHKRVTFDLARAALAASEAHGWGLLDHPGRLRVTTIDAFCAGLARQMPVLSRFGGQPRLAENAGRHYDDAARRALAWLEDVEGGEPLAEAVGRALAHLDNDAPRLAGLLAAMLARRDQWLRHALQTSVQEEAEAALTALVARDLARAAEVLPGRVQESLMPVARFAAANVADDHALAPLRDWTRPLRAEADELPLWRAVAALLLTDEGTPRKSLNKNMGFPPKVSDAQKQALLEIVGALSETDAAALAGVRRLPDAGYTEEEWATVAALAELLRLAAAELWTVFREAGEADFIEVASRALQALGEPEAPTDLALALDWRIRHLLVDEFQDTSPAQVALLQRLTAGWTPDDGRSLFLVGDPMQSIYRFRKADVGLFLAAAREGIGTVPLQRLSLYRNNRSRGAVVGWINAVFAGVFPAGDDAASGAIRYRPFAATREAAPEAGVAVHPLVAGKEEDGGAMEAETIVAIIDAERRADPARGIAVLVRARGHLDALVALIRRQRPDLAFTAVEIDRLDRRQPVQDLLSLTKALFHPADRVSWLAVLRAPWCGLTLADLHALAGDDHGATVGSLMNDASRCARLSADGRARLAHARAALSEALAHRGRQPVARWIAGTWMRLSGPACLSDAADAADCEAFLDLVARLGAAGRFTPERLEAEMEKLYGAPAAADGSLQFMTLHKSKGLEFDTVILPGLHRTTGRNDSPLMLWEEVILDGLDERLIAAPLKKRGRKGAATSYDYLAGLERARSDNEAARVLYVGATRAVRRLHLVGVAERNAKGEARPSAGTFLELLWPAIGAEFENAAEAGARREEGVPLIPKLIRLAEPVATGMPATSPPPPPAAARGTTASSPGETLEAAVGTLVHAYLEMIARDGLEAWPPSRIGGLAPAMEAWFARKGRGAEDARRGAAFARAALDATLASEAGRWVLKPRPGAAAELALAKVSVDGTAVHVVDRTFVEDGARWIVDYKTGPAEGDLAGHAEQYRPQLERYAALFAEEGMPARMAVFFTASGRLAELPPQPPQE